jgi:DNA polymerase-3 subunit beta
LSNFLFEAADNRLTITATDLDLSLRTSCAAKVKKEGACTIPARKLYDYVKLLPDGDISIKLLENHWRQMATGWHTSRRPVSSLTLPARTRL